MRIKRKEASKMQENIVKEYPAIFDICPKHWLQFEHDGIIEILKEYKDIYINENKDHVS